MVHVPLTTFYNCYQLLTKKWVSLQESKNI